MLQSLSGLPSKAPSKEEEFLPLRRKTRSPVKDTFIELKTKWSKEECRICERRKKFMVFDIHDFANTASK